MAGKRPVLAALLAFLLPGGMVYAGEPDPNIGVQGPVESVLVRRLSEELEALGYSAQTLVGTSLPAQGSSASIKAFLRADELSRTVELWLMEGGAFQLRETLQAEESSEDAQKDLARRAAESLRAHGLYPRERHAQALSPVASSAVASPPSPPRATIPSEPMADRYRIGLGPSVVWGSPSLQPMVNLSAEGQVWFWSRLAASVDVSVPMASSVSTGPEGDARSTIRWIGVNAIASTGRVNDVFVVYGALAGRLLQTSISGSGQAPYQGRTDSATCGGAALRLGAIAKIAGGIHARFDGAVGAVIPPVSIAFAGRSVVSDWGRPFVSGTLLLDVGWL